MEKGNPRFKPGDVVTVRRYEDLEADFGHIPNGGSGLYCTCEYGVEYVKDETPICWFGKDMQHLCGTEVTITEALWLSDHKVYAYHIRNNLFDRDKFFTETMFEVPGVTDLPELTDGDLMDFIAQ